MAPCRQLLVWSVPSIAVLLGIYWFRKRREFAKFAPGGREKIKCLQEELADALNKELTTSKSTSSGRIQQSVIKSAPINMPNGIPKISSLTDDEEDKEVQKLVKKMSENINSIQKFENLQTTSNEGPIDNSCIINTELETSTESIEIINCVTEYVDSQEFTPQELNSSQNNSTNYDLVSSEAATIKESVVSVTEQMETLNNETDDNTDDNMNDLEAHSFPIVENRHNSERDSANHSPLDHVLVPPSICQFSDNQSEGSSDSGKGYSEAASPPPRNSEPTPNSFRVRQFVLPQHLVGLLIGKRGYYINLIMNKTGTTLYIKPHTDSENLKICTIEGSPSGVKAALDMVRDKLPTGSYTMLDSENTQLPPPVVPEFLQLVESVNNDTIMTCIVSAAHFFLQQPMHPTFVDLHTLHHCMSIIYKDARVPSVPRPITEGIICAAPTENNWYRAQVVSTSKDKDTSLVKLVDYGGYLTVNNDQLKQIRSDFLYLPFQAIEVYLAFVKPPKNEKTWSDEALRIMASLTAGQILNVQIAGYDEAGIPLVNVYNRLSENQVIFLNRELVERGLAEWEVPPESELTGTLSAR